MNYLNRHILVFLYLKLDSTRIKVDILNPKLVPYFIYIFLHRVFVGKCGINSLVPYNIHQLRLFETHNFVSVIHQYLNKNFLEDFHIV